MTVRDLIKELIKYPMDSEVKIASEFNYDDEVDESIEDIWEMNHDTVLIETKVKN